MVEYGHMLIGLSLISGLLVRASAPFGRAIEWDAENKLHKISPLLEWTEEQIWQYIRARKLPYNSLHDRQYPSIGCSPCTRAIQPGENRRAGRAARGATRETPRPGSPRARAPRR